MSYTPPSGDAVELKFAGSYTSPSATAADLNFAPLSTLLDLAGVLEDITGSATLGYTPSLTLSGSMDDIVGPWLLTANPVLTLDGVLGDAVGDWILQEGVAFNILGTLDDITGEASLLWFSGVWRGLWNTFSGAFDLSANQEQAVLSIKHIDSPSKRVWVSPAWQSGTQQAASRQQAWSSILTKPRQQRTAWETASAIDAERQSTYSAPQAHDQHRQSAWEMAVAISVEESSRYNSPPKKHVVENFPYTEGSPRSIQRGSRYDVATPTRRKYNVLPWGEGNPHSWIWGGWIYPPIPPQPPYVPSPELVFYQTMLDYTGGAILEFNRPHCWAWPLSGKPGEEAINLHGVIIVLHTVNVVRLPDLTPVPTLSASLQLDSESWAWGVSLSLQTPQAMALLEPVDGEPRQVRIELDGLYFNALIESWGEQRAFGETRYTAQGRSALALLAAPFAPQRSRVETQATTAAQLIDYELTNTGWSAAYHSDIQQLFVQDWQIPAGAWSYQNLAPVEAIARVATAVGARAFADKTGQIVHIAPRYPISPWQWSTATVDKTLPVSLARSINTQLNPQPSYNQVYVSGTTQGVIVSVKRLGSAGDNPAPMITNPIMTHADAGRERGRNILGNTGRQARVTFDLPLNPVTGLFEPGQLVAVQDTVNWRGLVTAVNLQASHGAISQSVELERHYA